MAWYCEKCDANFKDLNSYTKHVEISSKHDPRNRDQWPECQYCGKKLRPESLVRHESRCRVGSKKFTPLQLMSSQELQQQQQQQEKQQRQKLRRRKQVKSDASEISSSKGKSKRVTKPRRKKARKTD